MEIASCHLLVEDGSVSSMEHVLCGAKREFEKIGKLWHDMRFVHPTS